MAPMKNVVSLDTFRLGVSVTTLLTVVVSVFLGGRTFQDFLTRFETIEKRQVAIEALQESMSARIVGRTPEGYHRRDHDEWCDEARKRNPDFDCPSPYRLDGFRNFNKRDGGR